MPIIMMSRSLIALTSSSRTSREPVVSTALMLATRIRLSASPLVAAEYLAKGYKLSDHILLRAIEIDSTHFAEGESKADL